MNNNSKYLINFFLYGTFFIFINSCEKHFNHNPLNDIIYKDVPQIKSIVENLEKHNLQIRYTQIDTTNNNKIELRTYSFQENNEVYFYPASTVKLPIVILTLEKLRQLKKAGINISGNTPFHIYDRNGNPIKVEDSSGVNKTLTINHLIKKIFLISDNNAYNYLFDFLGKDSINSGLKKRGIINSQIHHKFLLNGDNVNTWSYFFFKNKDTLYYQKSRKTSFLESNKNLKKIIVGQGVLLDDSIQKKPMDFTYKNRIPLNDLEGIILRVIFPDNFEKEKQFDLAREDYTFLKDYMSRSTLESEEPNYNNNEKYWDSYAKFFIWGDVKGKMDNTIRSYNKVGEAYGTLSESAYIENKNLGIGFLLSATILVNKNQIYNDGVYEYESSGIPFLAELGRQIYNFEKERSKKKQAHRPVFFK
ncbi:MAG: hypothetical protein CMC79_01520 [Flavobacteriaceae bacterium]|nr:hypothetical protein [Flavobacteriaceae bacterium]|tara:strand:+ start:18986 stop:20239 length:1254 start_codon:yes stop_codon:yes gene_type:complete